MPIEKNKIPISGQGGKVVGPRLLNSTQWGFLCPLHSLSYGLIKKLYNNKYNCMLRILKITNDLIITIRWNQMFIEKCNFMYLSITVKIIVNGDWIETQMTHCVFLIY